MKLIITDLDNTIYNWVDYFVPSFNAMVEELARVSGLEQRTLRQAFKRVHQRHGTTEYAFAIQELDVLSETDKSLTVSQILDKYSSAIRAFRRTRKKSLRLYEGVAGALSKLRSEGRKVVGHTDAMMFYAVSRMKQLGVEDLFDGIVAPKDHGLPIGTQPEDVRFYREAERYEARIPFVKELRPGIVKPNPECLNEILRSFHVKPHEAVYVGDSLHKDIFMAQSCGVHDVFAEYGRRYNQDYYCQLVEISHWTEEDVKREVDLKALKISPSCRIAAFDELLEVIREVDCRQSVREGA